MKRYLIQTFGCQMNVHDSSRIEEVLRADGYEPTEDPSLADLILFNTCSVREKAEHKLMSAMGIFRPLKETRRDLVMAVAGCVAQQEGDKLLRRARYLDIVLGPDNIPELPALVRHIKDGGAPITRTVFDTDTPQFLTALPRADTVGGATREVCAFVTVMKGCDERCTYCIVPYTRGPERYRAADDIVLEVARLVESGVREVTLLGQTVNSWYEPGPAEAPEESEFAALLRRIAREVPALERLRYTSPHPRHLTPALIAAHAELDVLPHHVHLPVQSGSDRVLKRMLRRYTRAEFIERTSKLCAVHSDMTLSTDLIVGFPGETNEEFEETLSLVREVGFVAGFAFKYSPRPYTPALKLGDDISEEIKDERLARLLEVIELQQNAHLLTLVGSRQRVLVESKSRVGETRFTGRSNRHEIVHVDAPPGVNPIGELLDVEIITANKHSLQARMEGAIPARAPSSSGTNGERDRVRLPLASGALP